MGELSWHEGLNATETIEGLVRLRAGVRIVGGGEDTRLLWTAPPGVLTRSFKRHLDRLRPELIREIRKRLYLARLCARLCDLGIGLSAKGSSVEIDDTEGNLTDEIQAAVAESESDLAQWLSGVPLPEEARAMNCTPYLEWNACLA